MDGGCKPIPEMSEEKTRLGRGGGVGLAPSPDSLQQVHITQKVGGGGACSLWGLWEDTQGELMLDVPGGGLVALKPV